MGVGGVGAGVVATGCGSPSETPQSSAKGDVSQLLRTIPARNPRGLSRLPRGERKTVLIVGGGIAGLSSALELSERGYEVTLKEAAPYLGGRLHTREESNAEGTFQVEHGLHMWFYQYYVFRDILQRLGVLQKYFRPFNEVYFHFKRYKPELIRSEGFYPSNLLKIISDSPNLNFLDAIGMAGSMKDIAFYNFDNVRSRWDNISFAEWARRSRVNPKFYDIVMEPAAGVTLNDVEKISAAEMLTFMHLYFIGHPKAFDRWVTIEDHGTCVIDPWADKIRSYGGNIATNAPVQGLRFEKGLAVGEVGESKVYDEVILATDVGGTQRVLEGSRADSGTSAAWRKLRDQVGAMRVAPHYKVWRLWLDKPTDPKRPSYQGVIETPESAPIDLICLFHLLEKESADWAKRRDGSVLEIHLYNIPKLRSASEDDLWKMLWPEVLLVLPELRGAKRLASSIGSYDNFTSYEVGQWSKRPKSDGAVKAGVTNLGLAGDWIDTNYPSALMERA
ncbi:MAG: FAD-dependent oxidoreductase, partial [Myxococcota bacterium]